ncbi:hypothetical protein [Flavobacterium stagni]|uniref:Uncharacterized protein n=1 Tax=Flavobacterium stagni TaxID=2506421 RepID=A0A4V1N2R6_9FLAO|nr:hypothetical protein [Flavobacterium stagni]RXR23041.1 hypothetical protein EQG61_07335 [Flavobacterium stagni]
MKDFIQSILDSSHERIKNPFIGSYITAFLIFNWRAFFLLIFSDAKIEDKIVVINHEYCSKGAIFWPLIISIIYILFVPYLNLAFDTLLSYSNTKKAKRKKEGIISKLLLKKEEAKYEREIADERAGAKEVKELQERITALENENQIKTQEITDLITKNNESTSNFKSRIDQLISERDDIQIKQIHTINESSNIKEIYNLLIDPKTTAIRDIKNYLRTNLSNEEFLTLKEIAENKKYMDFTNLPLSMPFNALLLKANVFELRNGKTYRITEDGVKFIQDLD